MLLFGNRYMKYKIFAIVACVVCGILGFFMGRYYWIDYNLSVVLDKTKNPKIFVIGERYGDEKWAWDTLSFGYWNGGKIYAIRFYNPNRADDAAQKVQKAIEEAREQ